MTIEEMAEQIREVHRICEVWENQPVGDTFKRPSWTRWFGSTFLIPAYTVYLGLIQLFLWMHVENRIILQLVVWLARPSAFLLIAYATVSICIDAVFMSREIRDFAKPIDSTDLRDLTDHVEFDVKIAKLEKALLQHVASFLEARSKKIESLRLFLIGVGTVGVGGLSFLLPPGSSTKAYLASIIPSWLLVSLQILLCGAMIGALLGLIAGWRRGINCSSRALTLRRILDNREILLGLTDSPLDEGHQ